jgi:penicillin G amidase
MENILKRHPLFTRFMLWIIFPFSCVFGMVGYVLYSGLPTYNGQIYVHNIVSRIEINRTEKGIPHIKSSDAAGAYFALGVCHAQDRLWQMEMNRRQALGTLSEVFGVPTVGSDKFYRTLGLRDNAQKIWKNLSAHDKNVLTQYANGVNEGIEQLKIYPVEFLLNRVKPEPWTPLDSIVIQQLMTWKVSTNFGSELRRILLLQNMGVAKTNQLMSPVALPSSIEIKKNVDIVTSLFADDHLINEYLVPKTFVGSNAWVVSGHYSSTGKPVLANDPHLATSMPGVWYLAHMEGADLNVTGATLPGLPFVVIGRNKDIAWGLTMMMADTQDLILEKINVLNKNQYENRGLFVDMTINKETIVVKNDFLKPPLPPEQFYVRRTVNGPLISDIGRSIDGFSYSLRWTGDDEDGGTIHSFIELGFARNWEDFNEALSTLVAPVYYIVYADRKGNIGSLAPGKIPIRKYGSGDIPIEGWMRDKNWLDWIPFSQAPRIYNPAKGYIVAANHKVIDSDYPYHISNDWARDGRAVRLESELARLVGRQDQKIQNSEMLQLQLDVKSIYGNDIFVHLSKLKPTNPQQEQVLNKLGEWDGNMNTETVGGAILQAWIFHFRKLLLEDDVEDIRGLEDVPFSTSYLFVEDVLNNYQSEWCDYKKTPEKETCKDIMYISLNHAIADLTKRLGSNPESWQWGRIHKVHYSHFPYSESKYSPHWPSVNNYFLSFLFHRDASVGGDSSTINVGPIAYEKHNRYSQFWGASYRQLINMKDASNIKFEQIIGQSGNVISEYFDNLMADGDHIQMLEGSDGSIKNKLILIPNVTSSE